MNAISALKELGHFDTRFAKNLLDAYLYWNYKVSNVARDAISYYNQQIKYKSIFISLIKESGYSQHERDKLNKLI
jgi:hypothetical protein